MNIRWRCPFSTILHLHLFPPTDTAIMHPAMHPVFPSISTTHSRSSSRIIHGSLSNKSPTAVKQPAQQSAFFSTSSPSVSPVLIPQLLQPRLGHRMPHPYLITPCRPVQLASAPRLHAFISAAHMSRDKLVQLRRCLCLSLPPTLTRLTSTSSEQSYRLVISHICSERRPGALCTAYLLLDPRRCPPLCFFFSFVPSVCPLCLRAPLASSPLIQSTAASLVLTLIYFTFTHHLPQNLFDPYVRVFSDLSSVFLNLKTKALLSSFPFPISPPLFFSFSALLLSRPDDTPSGMSGVGGPVVSDEGPPRNLMGLAHAQRPSMPAAIDTQATFAYSPMHLPTGIQLVAATAPSHQNSAGAMPTPSGFDSRLLPLPASAPLASAPLASAALAGEIRSRSNFTFEQNPQPLPTRPRHFSPGQHDSASGLSSPLVSGGTAVSGSPHGSPHRRSHMSATKDAAVSAKAKGLKRKRGRQGNVFSSKLINPFIGFLDA